MLDNPNNQAAGGTGGFGQSVAAGDVNGDGYGDLIVGADTNDDTVNGDEGALYVFYGSATGVTNHTIAIAIVSYSCTGPPDCSVLDNPNNEAVGSFGIEVAAADVNGDG